MSKKPYSYVIIKIFTMLLAIVAGGIWMGVDNSHRPRFRDEQTLVGGTVWSQTIIILGLIISDLVDDDLDKLIHAFFIVSGMLMFSLTGVILVFYEFNLWMRNRAAQQRQRRGSIISLQMRRSFNLLYFIIGILCLFGALTSLINLVLIV